MSGLTQDGTAELVPRYQFLRRERGQGKQHFPCYPTMSRNDSHTWSIYTFLRVLTIHTYSHLGMAPLPIFCNNIEKVERRFHFPGGGDVVCSPRVLRARVLSLRDLVSGYERGRVFPAGVGPGSPSRDAANWLPSRFGLSVETQRQYGWLRMVFSAVRLFRAPIWCPSGG